MAITADRLKREVESFMAQWHDGRDYIEAHTSGSTGAPKAIRLLKSDMLRSARATNAFFGIGPDSDLLLALSPGYIAGKMMCVRAEAAGCRLSLAGVSNDLRVERATDLLAVVPSQVDSLLADGRAPRLVRNLIVGGAPLDTRRENALVEAGFRAFATYGMTETCSHVALRPLGQEFYTALPGIEFDTDADSALIVKASGFSFGALQTNDVVSLADSHSFRWLGRRDNAINTGGVKVQAEVVEKALAPFMPKCEFFITGTPDPKWGQAVTLVVEGAEELRPLVEAAIEGSELTGPQRPKRLIFNPRFERTASGKVIRAKSCL